MQVACHYSFGKHLHNAFRFVVLSDVQHETVLEWGLGLSAPRVCALICPGLSVTDWLSQLCCLAVCSTSVQLAAQVYHQLRRLVITWHSRPPLIILIHMNGRTMLMTVEMAVNL